MKLPRAMHLATMSALAAPPMGLADTLHVPGDYPTIQEAIDAATTGDEVLVYPGRYYEPLDLLGKAITLRALNRAADLPNPLDDTQASIVDTQYDGRPSVVTCATGEGPDTVINGFTLTQGRGTDVDGFYCGGGMFLFETSPTVVGCYLHYNVSCNRGGGIYSDGGSPAVSDCIFDNNRATTGTQLYIIAGAPTFSNCEFRNYDTGVAAYLLETSTSINGSSFTPSIVQGRAVEVNGGSPSLSGCTLQNHGSSMNGAVSLTNTSATISGCAFSNNWNLSGGAALYITGSSPTVSDCTFTDNYANPYDSTMPGGGAVLFCGGSGGTISGCTFSANWVDGGGGGALACSEASSPTIEACTFEANNATYYIVNGCGGAIRCTGSSPLISNCDFLGNHADDYGGAVYCVGGGNPVIDGCSFVNNDSDEYGGALHALNLDSITLTDCTFQGNIAAREGGGARLETSDCIVTLRRCTFTENTAGTFNGGGGLQSRAADTTLIDCTFIRNTTNGRGGGVSLIAGGELIGCRFLGNHSNSFGGGLYFMGITVVTNCLFVGNDAADGGGIGAFANPDLTVINTALADNSAANTGQAIGVTGGSTSTLSNLICRSGGVDEIAGPASVTYSNIEGGYAGTGNLDADPLFVRAPDPGLDGVWGTADDDYGDLRLQAGSPCIDAADCTALPADVNDLDGDGDTAEPIPVDLDWLPRLVDDPDTADTGTGFPCVDMGAYEFQPPATCPGDIDGDGDTDQSDLGILLAGYNLNGDGDLDGDGDTDQSDLGILLADYGCTP